MKFRKFIKVLLTGVCAMNMIACANNATVADNTKTTEEQSDVVQIPNPFVDYASVAEALKHIDFNVSVPEEVEGYPEKTVSVMSDAMFQITYSKDSKSVTIRKQAGSEDISGDSTSYSEEKTVEVDGAKVKLSGEKGSVSKATWTKDGYTFAVTADEGLSEETILSLISKVQ